MLNERWLLLLVCRFSSCLTKFVVDSFYIPSNREVHELQMELASLNEYVKTTDAPYAARENREGNCGNCRDLNEKLEQSLTELEHMRDFYDELSEVGKMKKKRKIIYGVRRWM